MATFLEFQPHPLFFGGHLQTLAGFYWPNKLPPYAAKPHFVDVSQGDQIVLHEDCPQDWRPTDRVALMLHGLAGCHGSPYMVRIAARLNQRGVRTFRMDMRGCGAAAGRSKYPGHAGRSEDVHAALEYITRRCRDAPVTLIGFSMGGNIVLNAIAEASAEPQANLVGGIAVAPPVDLARCCRELQKGLRSFYDQYLVRRLIRCWRQTGGVIHGSPPRSIYQFDDEITAPMSGFRDAEDYYATASSGPRLEQINLRTRILAAQDDPMVAYAAIQSAPRSKSVELCLTKSGGHLGFMGRPQREQDGRWLDQQVEDWVTAED